MIRKLFTILCGAAIWPGAAEPAWADFVYSSGVNNITAAVSGTVDLEGGVLNIDVGGSVTGSSETDGFGINVTDGTLNIYGDVTGGSGTFAEGVSMSGGTVNIYSGSVMGGTSPNYVEGISLVAGTLNIYGGSVASGNGTYAEGINAVSGQVNMYHGTVQGGAGTFTYGIQVTQGTLNLEGGTVTAGGAGFYDTDLDVEEGGGNRTSTADIYGQNFNAPLGPLGNDSGTVTGRLEDGTALNLTYSQFPGSQIFLVPEPSGVALAGLSFVVLWLWRRRGELRIKNQKES